MTKDGSSPSSLTTYNPKAYCSSSSQVNSLGKIKSTIPMPPSSTLPTLSSPTTGGDQSSSSRPPQSSIVSVLRLASRRTFISALTSSVEEPTPAEGSKAGEHCRPSALLKLRSLPPTRPSSPISLPLPSRQLFSPPAGASKPNLSDILSPHPPPTHDGSPMTPTSGLTALPPLPSPSSQLDSRRSGKSNEGSGVQENSPPRPHPPPLPSLSRTDKSLRLSTTLPSNPSPAEPRQNRSPLSSPPLDLYPFFAPDLSTPTSPSVRATISLWGARRSSTPQPGKAGRT